MKNVKITFCLIMIFMISQNIYPQNYNFVEVGKSIKFGNKLGELGKNLQPQNNIPIGFIPGDIEIDIDNNFYIYDNFSKRILKYGPKLNFIFENQIPISNEYSIIDLKTDIYGNVYALIVKNGFFHQFLKYDNDGNLVNEFFLENPPPKDLRVGLRQISKDKIFIETQIDFSFTDWYSEFLKKNVWVYDLNGKFLGRCDFYYKDYESYIYKSKYKRDHITTQEDILYIEQYIPSTSIKPTSELELKSILSTKLPYNTSLRYVGSDKFNNLYFVEHYPFLLRVFNFKSQTVKELITEKDFYALDNLMKKFNVIITHHTFPFIISYSGDIYLYGIKVNKNNVEWDTECSSNKVELSIMKMKFNEEIK